jgi:hypothetical protein
LISSSSATDALWLDVLQRVSGRSAHELKGVLNGVAVNLEVVRSRAGSPDNPASAVSSFANAASSQFDGVMDMTEALLGLSRAAHRPVDLPKTVSWLVALLAPAVKADGRTLRVDGPLGGLGTTSADGNAVRLAVGAALLASTESCGTVVCTAEGNTLRLRCEGSGEGEAPAPGDDVVAAVREVGIEMRAEPSAIAITFPR